jgi:hypothetical protein
MKTFYRQAQLADLPMDRVEILRYYCRRNNTHIVLCNGVLMYSGPIPFKDGKYPFAKTVNEPFGNDFFWGQGMPGKYMGEQDLINSFINMMAQKTTNSLLPTGLSSDLDDLIEDNVIEIGKIRQVSDVNKWQWWEAPAVNGGEFNMFQTVLNLAKDSANVGAGDLTTAGGGKVTARQVLLKQQELVSKLSFNTNYLEDLEVDRTKLRLSHILQFYAIPRIERVTTTTGKELEELAYRDIKLSNVELSDGRKGNKIVKIIGSEHTNPDTNQQIADNLSTIELMGEEQGIPTEALAISADIFQDFETNVQVIKNSSFERNQALEQASRNEFVQARMAMAQMQPIGNLKGLIEWWEESYDIDPSEFEEPSTDQQLQQQNQQPGQSGQPELTPQQQGQGQNPAVQQQNMSQQINKATKPISLTQALQ